MTVHCTQLGLTTGITTGGDPRSPLHFLPSRTNAGAPVEHVPEIQGVAMKAIAHEVIDPADVVQLVETDLLQNGSARIHRWNGDRSDAVSTRMPS